MRALLFTAALLAAPLLAQPQMPTAVPGQPDTTRVAAGTYKVDPAHTQVLWRVNHLGFSEFDGAFADPTGTLTIDPKNPAAAKVVIDIPIARIVTTNAELDKHLLAADFFDVAKFPAARFVSTKIVVTGQTATIAGDLTLKGVTKPVTLAVRFIGAGPLPIGPPKLNFGFAATTSIRRSDFGLGYGVPMVSDRVDLTINAAFEAQ